MGDSGEYKGSQAYAQKVASEVSVTTNSGSVNFSRTLIKLRGVTKAISLSVQLSYTPRTQGSFGLPEGWGLDLSFIIPHRSLTSQGKTFAIDPDWSDETGWHSGLRYINHHGMKFEEVIPAEPLPSGQPGYYSWRFRLADGSVDYFDDYGKILEHDDIDGNSIYYAYADPTAGPLTAQVDHILDSWGQTIEFQYEPGASLIVIAPDGGQTTILFGSQGVDRIEDTMGYTTSFTYLTMAKVTLIDSISFPTGLNSKFEYILLDALDPNGKPFNIPACSQHIHNDTNSRIVSNTRYIYGEGSSYGNYTGASIGCRMGGLRDSLMECNNQDYRYDVAILRSDTDDKTLQMSRVYYNYLHLSMEEEHYLIDSTGDPQPAYRTVNTYNIPVDKHARATSYSQPVQVEQFYTNKPLRRATSTYDDFGCPLTIVEEMWNPSANTYITQKSVTSTYTATSWGGEMLESEIFADNATGRQRLVSYQLDGNKRHIASSSVKSRADSTSDWKPWKTKSYTYDTFGRVTVETVAWSTGVDFPQGSVKQFTYTRAYSFDEATSILTTSTTDPLGKTGSLSYQMNTAGGPLVQKTSPLGITETLKYDLLGRVIEDTDALGFNNKTTYTVGSGVTVETVNALGFIVKTTYDVLGRVIQVADSGNQGAAQAERVLSQTEYDATSNVSKSTNELGLIETCSYDSFSRLIQRIDIHGNVTTSNHDDDNLTTEHRLNGDLRTTTFADGLGRPTKVVTYADSASASSYKLILETVYNGFGKVVTSKHSQQPLDGSAATLLSQNDVDYDVEDKPYLTTSSKLPSTLTGQMDRVVRNLRFDIFGNPVTYTKTVNYGDGRQYTCNGPVCLFDACNRLVQLTNQLGQVETNEFDADGRLTTMTRYDGTKFNHTYDALGQLLSSISPDGTTAFEYLPNGRLAKITKGTATIAHTYSPDGSINSTVFPDGRKQTYVLDQYSRVTQQVDAAGRATENTFDANGRIATKQMGSNKIAYHYGTINHINGIYTGSSVTGSQQYDSKIAYDGFGRRSQVTDQSGEGSIILKSVYLTDSRGHVTSREVSSQTNQDAAVNNKRLFTYDGFGQLTSDSTTYQQGGAPAQTHEFQYDGNWNVIEKTSNGSPSQFNYNALDQRRDPGFVYDTNGRLSSDPEGRQYIYDSEDRLLSVAYKTTTTYTYHPDTSLANSATANANTSFYYSAGTVNSTLDTTGTGQSWTSHLLDPSRRIAAEKEGEGTTFFLNSQNSVVMSLGTATNTDEYQAYGSPTNTTNAPMFGWQQELADRNNGLVYLRSRYYQPDHMAFITMDSSRGQENRYAYCRGDPINLADASGHDATGAVAGMAVGILVGVLSCGALSSVGAAIAGVSVAELGVAASISISAASGAAGTIAGDATSAAIDHQPFTGARAVEDLLAGAIGGAVGAGSGGLAGRAAVQMASPLNESLVQYATASIIGGGAGAFASSGTSALLNNEPLFSSATALNTVIGFAGGALGAMMATGLPPGYKPPVRGVTPRLSDAEIHLITPAVIPPNPFGISHVDMFSMINVEENIADWARISTPRANGAFGRDVLRTRAAGPEHFTIIAHGEHYSMYATIRQANNMIEYRETSASVIANAVRNSPGFQAARAARPNLQVKLLSCRGAYSNAQVIADILQVPVWAFWFPVHLSDSIGRQWEFVTPTLV